MDYTDWFTWIEWFKAVNESYQ